MNLREFAQSFEKSVDRIRHLCKPFCDPLDITTFGYVRIYPNGRVSWITSNPDQDRFLIESQALKEEPLLNHREHLKEGHSLWFSDREFPGSEVFYRTRAQKFSMDHGLVIVKHQKSYVETCCFSGLLKKRALYNLFIQERGLFELFMTYFTSQLDRRTLSVLEEGIALSELKNAPTSSKPLNRAPLIQMCGHGPFLSLSKREKECLALLKKGFSYPQIGEALHLSERTVEHYLESVRHKLNLNNRRELLQAAEKLALLGL